MHEQLQQEIETFKERTPRSHAAHEKALHCLPPGVGSNFRIYEPYPIFVRNGLGGRIHDLDGNEYLDFNLCAGARSRSARTVCSGNLDWPGCCQQAAQGFGSQKVYGSLPDSTSFVAPLPTCHPPLWPSWPARFRSADYSRAHPIRTERPQSFTLRKLCATGSAANTKTVLAILESRPLLLRLGGSLTAQMPTNSV